MVQVMAVMLSDLTRSVNAFVYCLNFKMELNFKIELNRTKFQNRTIECAAFFYSGALVPKAMTLFKKISFNAALIPASGEMW